MRKARDRIHTSLKFGTSGLRGLVSELNGPPAYAYTRAFANMLKDDGAGSTSHGKVLIGRDLRASSTAIAQLCCAAVADAGLIPVDCGALPTPALAYHGMRFGLPAIMVTGSHIPDDRNGLKFYRASGEIDKADEVRILAIHARLDFDGLPETAHLPCAEMPDIDPLAAYKSRYLEFFEPGALSGLTIGVYQHSSVARDILVEVLEAMGATAVPLGRSAAFIPVDTEALRPEDEALAHEWASERRLDAIVSADGDADRPLIADSKGAFLRGDLVGAITAKYLGADVIVTPVTSNSALELCRSFRKIVRTRVGSPYVIEEMAKAARSGARAIIGFEANGGVLLGSDIVRNGRVLAALPTRDALLPIFSALSEMVAHDRSMAQLGRAFGFKATASNRLKNVASEKSAAFLQRLQQDKSLLEGLLSPFGGIAAFDTKDGLRLTAGNNEVVHFRASGNAPELRLYVEAATPEQAEKLLAWGLAQAQSQVS